MKNKITNKIKIGTTALAGALALASLPIKAEAQDKPKAVKGSLNTESFNRYLFRNITLSENPIVQSTASATWKDLSLIGIGIYDTKLRDFIEADGIVDITHAFKPATISAGYEKITVPNASGLDTQDAYVGITANTLLSPAIKGFYDWNKGNGFYGEASLSHTYTLNDRISLSGNTTLSFDNHYFRKNSGLRALTLGLNLPITLNKKGTVILTPKAIFQKSLDKRDFKDEIIIGGGLEVKF